MTRLDKAKNLIEMHLKKAKCGLYDSRNTEGDEMATVYKDRELQIDICYFYEYFEVFGLSNSEFRELKLYYNELRGE